MFTDVLMCHAGLKKPSRSSLLCLFLGPPEISKATGPKRGPATGPARLLSPSQGGNGQQDPYFPRRARREGGMPGARAKSPGCPEEPYLQLPSALRLCWLGPETITGSEISKVLTISCRAKNRWAPGLRARAGEARRDHCGQWRSFTSQSR